MKTLTTAPPELAARDPDITCGDMEVATARQLILLAVQPDFAHDTRTEVTLAMSSGAVAATVNEHIEGVRIFAQLLSVERCEWRVGNVFISRFCATYAVYLKLLAALLLAFVGGCASTAAFRVETRPHDGPVVIVEGRVTE